jgi:Raf kinase inhibitor-like YbhB/YbcL family protein
MQLSSAAFAEGQPIPRRHTCDGENASPPLAWSSPPPETKSFALVCDDPDAPAGVWRHWAVFDIPPSHAQLPERISSRVAAFKQGTNDFHKPGYGGPCPPRGHGPHRYRFSLLALDTESLALSEGAPCADVECAARAHTLAQAHLTGLYQR